MSNILAVIKTNLPKIKAQIIEGELAKAEIEAYLDFLIKKSEQKPGDNVLYLDCWKRVE